MTLKVLGPGGIPGQNASDVKISEFLERSTVLLSKYETILDTNLQILTEYSGKGGKEDMPLAMIGVQLKALFKQVKEAQDGSRIVTESLMEGFEKRIASTTAAIEAYSKDGGNEAYRQATEAVKERMRKAREAKAEKRAKTAEEKTEELVETTNEVSEQLEDIAAHLKPDPSVDDPNKATVEAITDLGDKLDRIAVSEADQALAELKERRKLARDARTEARHADRERRRDRMLAASGITTKAKEFGDKAYNASSDAVATGSSSAMKVGLAAMLGPASPLVNVLDKFVNIDDLTARTVGKLNPFREKEEEDKQLTALQKLRLNTVDGLYAVKDAVADGFAWMQDEALAVGRSRKIEIARSELNQALLLDRLQDLKPGDKKEGPLSGLGAMLKAGFTTLGGWLSKILAALGIKSAFDKIPGIGGGRTTSGPTGGTGGGGKGGAGKAKGWSRVGKAIGWAGAALGAYEIGSNFLSRDAEAKNRDTTDRAFDYGTGALAGATTGGMIGSVVPGVGTAIGAGVGALIGAASVGWKEYSEDIKATVSEGAKKARSLVNRAWQATSDAAASFYEDSKAWASNAYTVVSDKAKEWATDLKDKSKLLLDSASTRINAGIDSLRTSVSDFFTDTLAVFSNMRDKAVTWAKAKADALIDSIPQPVKDFSSATAKKVAAGAAVVAKGVKEGAAVAGQTARDMGAYAVDKGSQIASNVGTAANQAWESVKGVSKSAVNAWTSGGVKDRLVAASSRTGIDAGVVAKIAHFESKFDTDAAPIAGKKREAMNRVRLFDGRMGISSAHGLGQFTDATWQDSLNKWGAKYGVKGGGDIEGGKIGKLTKAQANTPELRTNEDLQALMLAELTKENMVKGRSLGGKDDDANVYAFHNLGGGDATALLSAMQKNPQMTVKDALLGSNPTEKKRARIESVIKGNSSLYGDGTITVTEAYQRMGKHMQSGDAFASDARYAQQQAEGKAVAVAAAPTTATPPTDAVKPMPPAVDSVVKKKPEQKAGLQLAMPSALPMLTAGDTKNSVHNVNTAQVSNSVSNAVQTAIDKGSSVTKNSSIVSSSNSVQNTVLPPVVETKKPVPPAAVNPIVVDKTAPSSIASQPVINNKVMPSFAASDPSVLTIDKLVPMPAKAKSDQLVTARPQASTATPVSPVVQSISSPTYTVQQQGNSITSSEFNTQNRVQQVLQALGVMPTAPADKSVQTARSRSLASAGLPEKMPEVLAGADMPVALNMAQPHVADMPMPLGAEVGAKQRSASLLGALPDMLKGGIEAVKQQVMPTAEAPFAARMSPVMQDLTGRNKPVESAKAVSRHASQQSDSIGLRAMSAEDLAFAQADPTVTMPTPTIGRINNIRERQASPEFAVQKQVVEMPKAQGTVNAERPAAPVQKAAAAPSVQGAPTGNLLNISNIPMFVNDWGMLKVNSHSIL